MVEEKKSAISDGGLFLTRRDLYLSGFFIMDNDVKFMRIALRLAGKGAGKVSPNPMVGCVIVKNGRIISTGYHSHFGGNHAEIDAIRNAKPGSVRRSTMYVNLEPCSHTNKKTPPCVPEIIKSGVKKVVVSILDPNPLVSGRGIKQLKKAGIRCKTGILENEAKEFNRFYIKWITGKTPYVILKWAMTLDGKIASKTGDAHWISSKKSRIYSHKLRGEIDAILVGVNTVLKDNPLLTVRYGNISSKNPVRILLDPYLSAPVNSQIFGKEAKTIAFFDPVLSKNNHNKLKILRQKCVDTIEFETQNKTFNLTRIMRLLAQRGISSVLVEGGGETHASALKYGIADEIHAFIAPKIIGGRDATTPVEGNGIAKIADAIMLNNLKISKIGHDILIKGKIGKIKCLPELSKIWVK